MTNKMYMNVETGSVDDYDGWWYEDETGTEVNAVDRGEVVEVIRDAEGNWIQGRSEDRRTRYGVKNRLTGEIVHRTQPGEAQTVHARAESWCKKNLGHDGEIVELPLNRAAAALGRLGRAAMTEAQATASREPGAKGGRPRKDAV